MPDNINKNHLQMQSGWQIYTPAHGKTCPFKELTICFYKDGKEKPLSGKAACNFLLLFG
jgi:hypothetical protein